MQLVVDVGNTETVIGLASGKRELAGHWRISSSVSRTIDEMTVLVRAFLSNNCLLYTSPSPRDVEESRMPSSA